MFGLFMGIAAIIAATDNYADLLRASVATPTNDRRLSP